MEKKTRDLVLKERQFQLQEFNDVVLGWMIDVWEYVNNSYVYIDEMPGKLDDENLETQLLILITLNDSEKSDTVQQIN